MAEEAAAATPEVRPATAAGVRSLGSMGVGTAPAASVERTGQSTGDAAGSQSTDNAAIAGDTKGADKAADAGGAPKAGALLRDGKDVSAEFVPVTALQQRVGEKDTAWRKRLQEKGLDPETLEPVKKEVAAKPAETLGTGPNDLWAEPDADKWEGTADEFRKKQVEVWTHNSRVRERLAEKAEADTAATEQQRADAAKAETERLTKYVAEDVPAFLKERSITAEDYKRITESGPEIGTPAQRMLVAGWVLSEASNMPAMLYELAQIPAADQARILTMDNRKLVAELYRIDARVQAGLGWDGKARAAAKKAVDTGNRSEHNAARTVSPPPQMGSGAAAQKGGEGLTGKDRHKFLEEQAAAEREGRIARRAELRKKSGR